MRWNLEWGIPDLAFLIFTDVIFNVIITVLIVLPLMSLFAKITPKKIEGTTFAFLTGTWNFGYGVVSPAVGTWINYQFVGVNKNDLSGYPTLCLISFICSLFNFLLLFLIPTKTQLSEWKQARIKEEEGRWELRMEKAKEREIEE